MWHESFIFHMSIISDHETKTIEGKTRSNWYRKKLILNTPAIADITAADDDDDDDIANFYFC